MKMTLLLLCALVTDLSVGNRVWAGDFSWKFVGPSGPTVAQLAAVSGSADTLLARVSTQLYRSVDGAASWQLSMNGLDEQAGRIGVERFVVSQADPDKLLLKLAGSSAIYRSGDGGKSWVKSPLPSGAVAPVHLAFHPAQAGRAYAVVERDAIYRSDDAGASWSRAAVLGEMPWRGEAALAIDSLARLSFGYTYNPVPGISLGCVSSVPENTGVFSAPQCSQPALNAIVATGSGDLYLLRKGLLEKIDGTNGERSSLLAEHDMRSLLLPTQAGTPFYLGTAEGVLMSRDQGGSWSAPGPAAAELPQVSALASTAGALYAATSLGVYKSSDQAGSWRSASQGLPGMQIVQLYPGPRASGIQYAIAASGNIVATSDDWASARPVALGKYVVRAQALSVDPGNAQDVVVGTVDLLGAHVTSGSIYRSTDGGKTWVASKGMAMVNVITRDPSSPARLYAGTGDGIYTSHDNGASWQALQSSLASRTGIYGVTALAVAPDNPRKLFAAYGTSVAISVDGGANWRVVLEHDSSSSPWERQLLLDQRQPATVYFRHGQAVYKSVDAGEHWSQIYAVTDQQQYVQSLTLHPVTAGHVYLGLSSGLWQSMDGGSSWQDAGLPVAAYALQINGDRLYVATPGGIYRTQLSGVENGGSDINGNNSGAGANSSNSDGKHSDGGCSLGRAGNGLIDPTLWLLAALAALGALSAARRPGR